MRSLSYELTVRTRTIIGQFLIEREPRFCIESVFCTSES